jgi:hypothetical protein
MDQTGVEFNAPETRQLFLEELYLSTLKSTQQDMVVVPH